MESDWPKRNKSHYVTEIVSWLGFADPTFRQRQATAGNTSALAGYNIVFMSLRGEIKKMKNEKNLQLKLQLKVLPNLTSLMSKTF